MQNLTIAPASFADLERLLELAERTFRVAFEHNNDPGHFKKYCDEAFTLAAFRRQMEHPHSRFWLAEAEGQLAGYLKLNFDEHPAELASARTVQVERLYIEPALQGRHIGERLLDFAHRQARAAAAEWLWLSVWQINPPAVRFYERCGYEIFGTETFWVGDDPQIDWLMRKKVETTP
jgi:diamine N-acetyltransferase